MDIEKLSGILSAIDTESRTPSPSHQNLARLITMFFRELLEVYKKAARPAEPAETLKPESFTTSSAVGEVEDTAPKKRGRKKVN